MARPRQIDKGLVAKARRVIAHTTDLEQLRAAQAMLLPALASATLEQTAAILRLVEPQARGCSGATASRYGPVATS